MNCCVHEFLHTWTPLTIHSDKIENYNFEQPDMSENMWFYEGFTDYLTDYIIEKNKVYPNYLSANLSGAIGFAKKQKEISFTESCLSLGKHSLFDAFQKSAIMDNCYQRGKIVAFCMDAELMKLSNGNYRLKNLMTKLYTIYALKKAFQDNELIDVIVNLTYPEMRPFLEKYVKGKDLPPYQDYLDKFGWKFIAKNENINSFGDYSLGFDYKSKRYFFLNVKNNPLGVINNDTLISVNNKPVGEDSPEMFFPEKNDSIKIEVIRNGKIILLHGTATAFRKKISNSIMKRKASENQKLYYDDFFRNKA